MTTPDERAECGEALTPATFVRDHLPVKPDREGLVEAMSAALHVTADRIPGLNPGPVLSADCTSVDVAADAVLALLPGRTEAGVKAEALREAADWLLRVGYVTDFTFDTAAPAALWEAFVDAAHRDADGAMHGNTLTRAEVDDWLSEESGRIAAEGGAS